jgi:hypothetical protein
VKAEYGRVDTIGCVGPFYSKIIVFSVLRHMSIVVFNLLFVPINRTLDGLDSFLVILTLFAFLKLRVV